MAANQYLQPFFDSLSQGVQVAQHIASAAQQAREFQQTQTLAQSQEALRQQEFDAQQQQGLGTALQNGAQPVSNTGQVPLSTPLPRPSATTDAAGGMTVDPGTANPQTSIAGDPNRQYQIGGQTLQAPTLQDQLDRETATRNIGRVPLTQAGSDMIGGMFPAGTPVDPAHMPGLAGVARANAAANKGEKPTKYEKAGFTDKGEPISFNPDTNEYTTGAPIPGAATPAAGTAASGEKQMTPNELQAAKEKELGNYQARLKEKNELESENANIAIALKTGKHYVDKQGNLTAFDKGAGSIPEDGQSGYQDGMRARLAANQARLPQIISDMQGAQNRYADLSGNNGARPQTPKVGAPATPKVASMAKINAYAAKFKVTQAQAIAAAKSDGYTIASR